MATRPSRSGFRFGPTTIGALAAIVSLLATLVLWRIVGEARCWRGDPCYGHTNYQALMILVFGVPVSVVGGLVLRDLLR